MESMTLKANNAATKRTKERIKQFGPEFFLIRIDQPVCMGGVDSLLVESIHSNWKGWLPKSEVENVH